MSKINRLVATSIASVTLAGVSAAVPANAYANAKQPTLAIRELTTLERNIQRKIASSELTPSNTKRLFKELKRIEIELKQVKTQQAQITKEEKRPSLTSPTGLAIISAFGVLVVVGTGMVLKFLEEDFGMLSGTVNFAFNRIDNTAFRLKCLVKENRWPKWNELPSNNRYYGGGF